MAVGPGDRAAVDPEHERGQVLRDRRPGGGHRGQHPLGLVADPVTAAAARPGPSSAGGTAPGRPARGRRSPPSGRPRPVRPRPPARPAPGARRAGHRARAPAGPRRATAIARSQALAPVVVLGPDEGGQPAHGVLVGDVERVEVDAAAPGDRRRVPGQRRVARHVAGQQRAGRRGRAHHAAGGAPGVVVAVGVEAQPGAGADLEQRERPAVRERGERRGEGGEPPDLVGLRRPAQDRGPDRRRRRRAARPGGRRTDRAPARRASAPRRTRGWAAACPRAAWRARPAPRGRRRPPLAHSSKQGDAPRASVAKSAYCAAGSPKGSMPAARRPARRTSAARRTSSRGTPRCPRSRPRGRSRWPSRRRTARPGSTPGPVLTPTIPNSSASASRSVRARSRV